MEAHAVGGKEYSGKCFICHSNCISEAEMLRDAVPVMEKAVERLEAEN